MSQQMKRSEEWLDAYNKRLKNPQPLTPPLVRPLTAEHGGGGGRANKFGAIKSADGDSKKEVRDLQELKLREKAGEISFLIPHVRYRLLPAQYDDTGKLIERAVHYTCDAQYLEGGKLVVQDSKSAPTRAKADYILRRKLMLSIHGIEIREV